MALSRVLVVASNPFQLALMCDLLEANDVRTMRATTAIEALDVARRLPPSIVLVDLDLPPGEPDRVRTGMRSWATTRDVPLLAIGDNRATRSAPKRVTGNWDGCLDKPIDTGAFPREILARIRLREAAGEHASQV